MSEVKIWVCRPSHRQAVAVPADFRGVITWTFEEVPAMKRSSGLQQCFGMISNWSVN